MPPSTRRYEIQLVVNAQAGPGGPNQLPTTPGALDGMIDRIGRYLLGVQGLRMAWRASTEALQEYYAIHQKMAEQQQKDTQKAVDWDRALAQYYRNEGGFTDPSKMPALRQNATEMAVKLGFQHPGQAAQAMQFWASDVGGYTGDPGDKGKLLHLSGAQGKEMFVNVMRSARASGVDPHDAARAASAVVGSTDWQRLYGKDAGAHAYSAYEKVIEGLTSSRADLHTNIKNLVPYINEMIKVNRQEGRITGAGETGIEEAVRTIRDLGEYKPEQAETLGRNAAEAMRNLNRPGMRKAFKDAGLDFVGLMPNLGRVALHYEKLKDAGKIKEGETIEDYLRNTAKINIRGSAGIGAIIGAEKMGLGEAVSEKMAAITPQNAAANLAAFRTGQPSVAMDESKAAQAAADREFGFKHIKSQQIIETAIAAAKEAGWGKLEDPRNVFQKGFFRGITALAFGQKAWDSDETGVGDSAQFELYKRMVAKLHPLRALEGRGAFLPEKEQLIEEYYGQEIDERRRLFELRQQELVDKNGEGAVLEVLKEMRDELKANASRTVPPTPQAAGMDRH